MKNWSVYLVINTIKRHAFLLLTAFICFICIFIIFDRFIQSEEKKIKALNTVKLADHANDIKSQLNSELNALIYLSNGISSYLTAYHNDLDEKKLNTMLASLYKEAKHIRNFGIAIGYHMRFVYPLAGNEAALNIDYRKQENQWPLVKKTINSRQGLLAGPIQLVQGGSGLIYRYPVYINDQYWGILSTVIDTDSFLKASFNNHWGHEYNFAIRVRSEADMPPKLIYGDLSLFSHPDAFLTTSNVPNAVWEWAIIKKVTNSSNLIYLIKVMSWVISLLIASGLFIILKDRKALKSEAKTDSLTGLPNRHLLNIKLNQSLKVAQKQGKLMGVMFVDLDYFKQINDTYGHDVGDEVLKRAAVLLLNNIRADDTLSRIGGDEFVIVLNELDQASDASDIAKKIIDSFVAPISVFGQQIDINLSIGIAIATPSDQENNRSILKKADIALYEAKSSGRNKYITYQEK